MKNWMIRVVFLCISFVAAALSQYFYTANFGFHSWERDAFALILVVLLIGFVFMAPYYYFAKKVLPSPGKLLGANVLDIIFGLLFIVVGILWIYTPQSQGFSFADGKGLIIDRGIITTYGHQVKLQHVLACVLVSSFYILLCGIWQRFIKGN